MLWRYVGARKAGRTWGKQLVGEKSFFWHVRTPWEDLFQFLLMEESRFSAVSYSMKRSAEILLLQLGNIVCWHMIPRRPELQWRCVPYCWVIRTPLQAVQAWAASGGLLFSELGGYRLLWSKWASLVAQMVECPPALWETWVQSPGREDPLE